MQWLKGAFAVDPPGPAEPTERQLQVVDKVCREVARRRLTTPALSGRAGALRASRKPRRFERYRAVAHSRWRAPSPRTGRRREGAQGTGVWNAADRANARASLAPALIQQREAARRAHDYETAYRLRAAGSLASVAGV